MAEEERAYHPVDQPDDVSIRDREDAMGAYFMMFAALAAGLPLPIINLIAAIIYYYLNRGNSRFVKFHSLQSLYSQIPTSLLNAGLVYWTIRIIIHQHDLSSDDRIIEGFASVGELYWGYLYVVIGANLLYLIFSVVGAVRARKGRMYYFIFFGKLAYHVAYRRRDETTAPFENRPPA